MQRYLLSLLLATITGAVVPLQPPELTEEQLDLAALQTENFDPARANTYENITCVGARYSLNLPLQDGWNPNERTMQELCAKPQFQGGPPGQHLGGWCNHNEVVFDYSVGARVSTQLFNPRLQLGCRYRCFCNHQIAIPQRSTQPKPSEHQQTLQVLSKSRESFLTHEIRLDIQALAQRPGSLGDVEVDIVRLSQYKQVRHQESLETPHYEYASEDEGNKIVCDGPLPSYQLPPPYTVSQPSPDFHSNQQLCAVQLNGGLLGANAGGYCHRSNGLDPTGAFPAQTIWFSDEMTPRLDWTWGGGNFFASASIRMHCYRHCQCSYGRTDRSPTAGVWRFVRGHQLALRESGRIELEAWTGGGGGSGLGIGSGGGSGSGSGSDSRGGERAPKRIKTSSLATILPSQDVDGNRSRPGSNASGSCGLDGRQFCLQAWPVEVLGVIPFAPPEATEVVKPGAGDGAGVGALTAAVVGGDGGGGSTTTPQKKKADLTVCGNRCLGPQDCHSGNETDYACTCAFPNTQDAKWLGLDPVMPVSVCLVLLNMAFGTKQQRQQMMGAEGLNGRRRGRRNVVGEGYLDGGEEGGEWLCRCNSTFSHTQCCGSGDGMIWLY